ncbi:MAG: hypothetical protein LBQ57_12820 [Spirochaetales bacterium]|nr:hypothetical protein [Spirochaetales bacterium]
MKKFIFFGFLIAVLGHTVLLADEPMSKSNDYIAHCNFAFGFSYAFGGEINGSQGLNITLVDRYSDTYHFNYRPGENDRFPLGFNIMLSLPFVYREYFSVGMYGQALLNGFAIGKDSTLFYGGGVYGEGIYKQFSLRAGLGIMGVNVSKSVGKVVPAWPGDPGYYTGSKFVRPGETLTASSNDFLGIAGNIAIKYYPFKQSSGFLSAFFLQLGYYFFPGIEVSGYDLKLDGTTVSTSNPLPSFKVDPTHAVSLLVGIGL